MLIFMPTITFDLMTVINLKVKSSDVWLMHSHGAFGFRTTRFNVGFMALFQLVKNSKDEGV